MFNNKIAYLLFILPLVMVFCGCVPDDVPPIKCKDPDFDCYFNQAIEGVKVVRNQIAMLSKLNLILQILIAVFGITATVMIALQGDRNKHWTRPIGLVATALVTGLSSALVTFHIPESIDTLIDVVDNMVIATNKFDDEVEKIKAGRSDEAVKIAYQSDKEFRESVGEATTQFCKEYNAEKIHMLRIIGSVGRLSTIPLEKATNSKEENDPNLAGGAQQK